MSSFRDHPRNHDGVCKICNPVLVVGDVTRFSSRSLVLAVSSSRRLPREVRCRPHLKADEDEERSHLFLGEEGRKQSEAMSNHLLLGRAEALLKRICFGLWWCLAWVFARVSDCR